MDANEYEAVVEQHVRAMFELGDDEPLPPPGPVALEFARMIERERPFAEAVARRQAQVAPAIESVMRLAQRGTGGPERPEIVWRDPAVRRHAALTETSCDS